MQPTSEAAGRLRGPVYIIYIHKVPLRDVPRGVVQELTENVQLAILYQTHMISYYDVMKYLCASTCGTCMYHTAAETRRPTDRRIQ